MGAAEAVSVRRWQVDLGRDGDRDREHHDASATRLRDLVTRLAPHLCVHLRHRTRLGRRVTRAGFSDKQLMETLTDYIDLGVVALNPSRTLLQMNT